MMKYFLGRCILFFVLLIQIQKTNAQQKIDLLEYGIDAIPAYGLATPITVSTPSANLANFSFNVNVASVSTGLHTLFIRSHSSVSGDSAKWSITNFQYFYKLNNTVSSLSNINKLEYFMDSDPGEGKAIAIGVTPASQINGISFSPNISSLTTGFHTLFVRSVDANGIWGITNTSYFYKQNNISAAISNIVKLEYFIDSDPGEGKAAAISVTPASHVSGIVFSPDISALTPGFHILFIRSLDANGKWGITNNAYFYKQNSLSAPLSTIAKIEYFIDADPGAGNGKAISFSAATNVSNLSFSADVSSLATGFHILFIRSMDANGKWSITNYIYFYKSAPQNNTSANIVKIEYYIDTDPGYFDATNIPITAASDISNQAFNADLTGLSAGTHYLDIRSLDSRGKWSVTAFDTFNIASTTPLKLLNFSAFAEDTIVNINWQTAFELNLNNFEIEHSTDGFQFMTIGKIAPINNSSGSSYNFKDISPSPGENFYRLKIVENDGSYSYSAIKVVRFDNGSNFVSIYPNPVNDNINVLFKQLPKGNVQLRLMGINGKTLQMMTYTGSQLKQLNVSNLPDGIYEVHVESEKVNIIQKIVVQH